MNRRTASRADTRLKSKFALFTLIGLVLSPLAVANASPPFDHEQWRHEHPRPAGKALAALNRGEPRTVRMIYFLPNDDPYRADEVDGMKTTIRRVQTFYAEQMQAHGYGNTTFRFETDAQGEPVVHRVDGRHPTRHYQEGYHSVSNEIKKVFDLEANVYLVFTMNFAEGGRAGKSGGVALVGSDMGSGDYDDVVAHELGHAFGLNHDFRDETYVMSYGIGNRLSACSAEFLAVHPYFDPNSPIEAGSLPTIELLTPSRVYTEDVTSVPIRIRARASDGLHQVLLLVGGEEFDTHFQVKACRGLVGEREAVVEFDYDGVIPTIRESGFDSFKTQKLAIGVVDALGDATWSDRIELVNRSGEPIATFVQGSLVYTLSFSSDGRLLASAGLGGTVKVWDTKSGKTIATLKHKARSLSFSPDGKLLASGGGDEGTVKVWDVSSGKTVTTLKHEGGEYSGVSSVAFSPDGRLLASGGESDYQVKVWDTKSDKTVTTFSGHRGTVRSVVFSPDGRLLASGEFGGTVKVWDIKSGKTIATLEHGDVSSVVSSVAFSPNGKLLASGDSRGNTEVKLWDVSTGKSIATLPGSAPVFFFPNGRMLASRSVKEESEFSQLRGTVRETSAYGGFKITLWDVSTGESIGTLPPVIGEMALSSDGRMLASRRGGEGSEIGLWDIAEWTQSSEQTRTAVEQAMPHALTKVSGDGQEKLPGAQLAKPFVVSVLDQNRSALAGAVVTFSVTAGGGTLSATTTTTDANGRARTTLTLGPDPGTNTVKATVAALESVIFTATATEQTPHSLTKVSGDSQAGPASTQLAAPFVVSVLDQDGSPLSGVAVTFSVTAGGGLLSSTTASNSCAVGSSTSSTTVTTDANGQAATRLTLGSELGTNTVLATVEGLESATFTATAAEQGVPHSLTKVCGDDQEGTAGAPLTMPLVVSVSDEDGAAMAGVVVSFAVTSGRGTLSSATATTNANGRAATRLTLGSNPETNMVSATVEGLASATFTATGQEDPLLSLFGAFGSGKLVALPDRTQLLQNAPNPFNSQTILSYFLLEPGPVRLEVFALSGQRVAVLHQGPQQAGYHRLHWDGRDAAGHPVASGAYLYRLVTDEVVLTRKLILLR